MQSWTEIKNIENPTEEQQLEAIKLNWYAISLIQNPTETVQKAAFEKNEQAILYVKCGPCEALKQALNAMDEAKFLAAFKAEPNLLKFITNPALLKKCSSLLWNVTGSTFRKSKSRRRLSLWLRSSRTTMRLNT